MIERAHPERVGSLLIDALISEVLEDLFERSLAYTVLLDVHFLLVCLDLTEQVANGLVLARHSNLVEVAALLDKLNLIELTGQQGNKLEAVHLDEEVLEQSSHPDFSVVNVSLCKQVRTDATLFNLVKH